MVGLKFSQDKRRFDRSASAHASRCGLHRMTRGELPLSRATRSDTIARMRYRKLRIAWSVLWSVAAVLLILLWAHSYGRQGIHYFRGTFCETQSSNGRFAFTYHRPEYYLDAKTNTLQSRTGFMMQKMPEWLSSRGLNLFWSYRFFRIELPYKLLLPLAALVTIAPWIPSLRFSFSLRSLLIATTLIAFGLGMIVYAIR